jgi:hypothetical protein
LLAPAGVTIVMGAIVLTDVDGAAGVTAETVLSLTTL